MNKILAITFTFLCTAATYAEEGGWVTVEPPPCREEHTEEYVFGFGVAESFYEQAAVEKAVVEAKMNLAGDIGPTTVSRDFDGTMTVEISPEAISKASKSVMSCKTTKQNEDGGFTAYVSVRLDRPTPTTGGKK